MPYLPINSKLKSWEIANIPEIGSGYENIVIDSRPIGDKGIADLIASADVVVQPSYSEGFGLSILEAMAMEKLVITTLWSGESEFVTDRNSLVVKNNWIDSENIQYGGILKGAKMKRPDTKHLEEIMEYSFLNYCELSGIRANALITSKKYTWEKTAENILKVLQ
jgi:glycosyltransferase involved in cell wall biosynthesis